MKAKDLKKSILQLAIQGKLVPQDPKDEPASKLLDKIRAAKQKLIQEGKLKKEKVESVIYKGDDNNYYEKIGQDIRNITDEIPFEIPDSWAWVRVKDIAEVYTGNSIAESIKRAKYTNLTEGYNYIGTKDVGFDNVIDYENGVKIPRSEPKFRYAFPNDILLCIEGGSAGRKIGILREQVCFGNKLCNFHQYFNSSSYMYYFLQTPSFVSIFKENMTGIIGGVSRDKIQNILFPLPPLEEQKRIVSKIVSLEPVIDDYDQVETELSALNNSFPEQIKKSILQYAIQGKLVPQDPKDEPASVLLEKIKAEKLKLIKAGKIKKDKQESYIYKRDNRHYEKIGDKEVDITDEIPFEIPDSWAWVRLKNLVHYHMGKTPQRKNELFWEKGTFPWVSIADLVSDGILGATKEKISVYALSQIFKGKISPKGTLLMSFKLTVGKVSILNINAVHNEAIISIYPYLNTDNIIRDYLFKFMPLLSQEGHTKTAIKGKTLNSDSIDALLIPLPPLGEQNRIVAKVEELLKLLPND